MGNLGAGFKPAPYSPHTPLPTRISRGGPATIGNYTYIPIPEFLERWHDQDRPRQKLYNFGMVIDGKPFAYDPDEIKRMN